DADWHGALETVRSQRPKGRRNPGLAGRFAGGRRCQRRLFLRYAPSQSGAGGNRPRGGTPVVGCERGAGELGAGFPASHQLAPAAFVNLDAEFLRRRSNAPPGRVPLAVADALDLVEAGDCVADVTGVVKRLIAFFLKRDRMGPHPSLLLRTQARGFLRHARAARPSPPK